MNQRKHQQGYYCSGQKNKVNYQDDDEWGKPENLTYAKKRHQGHRIRHRKQQALCEQSEIQFIENEFVVR